MTLPTTTIPIVTAANPARPAAHKARSIVPIFSPTKLKSFHQCPEQYLRRYHVGPRQREPFSRPLERGKATHKLLARYVLRSTGRLSQDGASLDEEAVRILPRSVYPSEEVTNWEEDLAAILRQVAWGMEAFERRYAAATVLLVEEALGYYHRHVESPEFRLEATLDLVVLHPDGVLEHVDWKTGRFEPDATQNLISRIVVGRNAAALTAGRTFGGNDAMRSTALYAEEQRAWSEVYTRDMMREGWHAILDAVTTISEGLDNKVVGAMPWRPKQSGLCGSCVFAEVCSLNTVTDEDEAMTAWLAELVAVPLSA